jgi:FkbM family methyltransferase
VRLFHRDAGRVLRAPFEAPHYRALKNLFYTVEQPVSVLSRYLFGAGSYPWTVSLRTPLGTRHVLLRSRHDLVTVIENFCRMDYGQGGAQIVVDMGANIGVSALFFITRRPDARVYCFEPDPRNIPRLRGTLAGLETRYEINPAAVAVTSGRARFSQEPSGRYGSLIKVPNESGSVEVQCLAIEEVLGDILRREGRIDLLKIDTEGNEPELIAAIPPSLRGKIREIYCESNDGRVGPFHLTS